MSKAKDNHPGPFLAENQIGWRKFWRGMPEFGQKDLKPLQSIQVHLRSPADREAFGKLVGRPISNKTQSIWYPREAIGRLADKCFRSEKPINPRWPLYIVSKGRWNSRLTSRALEEMRVPHWVVVEEQERDEYEAVIGPMGKVLVLDKQFQRDYQTLDDLGDSKSRGPGPARNFAWNHAKENGKAWHWVMDDNIKGFYRLFSNLKTPVGDGTIFRCMEDFVGRFQNVGMAGPNYFMFADRKAHVPPFVKNTRIYSCSFIKTDQSYRWRGRYNEDTILSLDMLKGRVCTIQFNAFLQYKMTTQTLKGGNTDEVYDGTLLGGANPKADGTLPKSKLMEIVYPGISKVVWKWGRWHHVVDYSSFKNLELESKADLASFHGVDNYGMFIARDEGRRLLIVGQAPVRTGDPSKPMEGKLGHLLANRAGIAFDEYLKQTDRMNLLDEYPGKDGNGKGDAWDAKVAERWAAEKAPALYGRRVLLIGKNVASAFGLADQPWLQWEHVDSLDADVAVIPHPSGIVRWWNDKDNRRAASGFLKYTFAENQNESKP